ncbi:hypothetical protein B0H21DRAFT_734416 [Amylocystis lapponica]|nr:hypothetical protein B0H21DRAFT_734416 [Amylocystis lapponica]
MRHNFLSSVFFLYALPYTSCLVCYPSRSIGLTARLMYAVRHARIVTRLAILILNRLIWATKWFLLRRKPTNSTRLQCAWELTSTVLQPNSDVALRRYRPIRSSAATLQTPSPARR